MNLDAALTRGFAWLENNGWAGYDPYDVRGTSLFVRLNKRRLTSAAFKIYSFLFPLAARQTLKVIPQINAKAVALIAHAYLDRYAVSRSSYDLEQAQSALNWLVEHPSNGYAGLCWGYPFDWDNRTFIPKGTPSSVVTAIALEAFLRAHELLGEQRYLETAQSCAAFITQDLNRDEISADELCFSYTPLDHWHVHNANLFSCATLARVSQLTSDSTWDDLIRRGTRYTLNAQRPDGAWAYWGPPDRGIYMVDHYHTGYVLRCLDAIRRHLEIPSLDQAVERGYQFYRQQLFTANGLPKRTESDLYPVDIHSCAEAIICLTHFGARYPDGLTLARQVADWTAAHMQAGDGHFYYRKYPALTIRIPFVRWSQAWMLRALSSLLVT